jgi:hypothetical protein
MKNSEVSNSTEPATFGNAGLGVVFFQITELKDLKGEVWESAFGLDGLYEVSNYGRVKSLGRTVNYIDGRVRSFPEKIIRQCKVRHGNTFSLYVRLAPETGVYKNYTVAALVLNSFRKPNEYSNSVHHINFNSYDNRLNNLTFENFSIKRKIEFKKGIRSGEKNTKHWKESGLLENNAKRFMTEVYPLNTKGKTKTFEQAGKKYPITIFFKSKNEVQVFSSVRNAMSLTGLKKHTIYNAIARPHKYKRLVIKKGVFDLAAFLK